MDAGRVLSVGDIVISTRIIPAARGCCLTNARSGVQICIPCSLRSDEILGNLCLNNEYILKVRTCHYKVNGVNKMLF